MKTAFLGSGNMARAIIGGMVKAGAAPGDISVTNPGNTKSCGEVRELYGVAVAAPEALGEADLVVLAFKPQTFPAAAAEYGPRIREGALVVSIMAGVTLDGIREALGDVKAVRVMPNLALAAGYGASGYALGPGVTEGDEEAVRAMFSASGIAVRVDEGQIDGVGALSGSGPAYICLLLEALRDAAVGDGFDAETAALLTRQTLLGTAALLYAEDIEPEELRRRVTSPKGTTLAALDKMRGLGLPEAVMAGYYANKARSAELSKR